MVTGPSGVPAGAADPAWAHPAVPPLLRLCRRAQHGDRARPWLLDALLVLAVLLAFGLPDLLRDGAHERGDHFAGVPTTTALLLQLGLAVPLLWRRRHPEAVFTAVVGVFAVQWAVNVWLHADIALLLAVYTVTRHGRLRQLPWIGAATLLALTLVVVRVSAVVSPTVALFFLCSAALAAGVLGLAVRVGTAYLGELRERAVRLEVERDHRARLAAAAERTRVAREMHDIVGHNLAVIIGLADGGSYAATVSPERSAEALRLIAGTGRQALHELRRMLGVLREESAEEGAQLSPQPGTADLHSLCDRVRAAGPAVTYRTVGDPESLDRGMQLTAYRIVQEALTNTLKHAGAGAVVHLTVAVEDARVRILVEDDGGSGTGARTETGTGRPTRGAEAAGTGGQGLAGMRERAALHHGQVTAGPRPGGGWAVDAVLESTAATGVAMGTAHPAVPA